MNCLRCRYPLREQVQLFSQKKFGFAICKNCQDWYLWDENEPKKNKKQLLENLIKNPYLGHELTDYKELIEFYGSFISGKGKDNHYTYFLRENSGIVKTFNNVLLLDKRRIFDYESKKFKVIRINDKNVYAREFIEESDEKYVEGINKTNRLILEETIIRFFERRGNKILPNSLNEESFKNMILEQLSGYFEIREEVWGRHFSGKKMRIDAILTPFYTSSWKNQNLKFGLEIKNPLTWSTTGRRDVDLLAQCMDYSNSRFDGADDLIIIMCPLLPKLENEQLLRFISRYNVGYLNLNGKAITMQLGVNKLWDERYIDTDILRRSMLISKFGNRSAKWT